MKNQRDKIAYLIFLLSDIQKESQTIKSRSISLNPLTNLSQRNGNMKEIEKAIMNEIIFLRMQGLSDRQVKKNLETEIIKGMKNASDLCPNRNNDQAKPYTHTLVRVYSKTGLCD